MKKYRNAKDIDIVYKRSILIQLVIHDWQKCFN